MSLGAVLDASAHLSRLVSPTADGFEVPAGTSATLRRSILAAHITGMAGIVLLVALLAGAGHIGTAVASLAAGGALVALSWRRVSRTGLPGTLAVADRGSARWTVGAVAAEFEPSRWCVLGGLAWIDGLAAGRPTRLLLGREEAGDAAWRRLMAWLRWMDRGGRPRPEPLETGADGPR